VNHLRSLVVQMLCGGNFTEPTAFSRPLEPLLVDRCEQFIRFNWPDFKVAIEQETPP